MGTRLLLAAVLLSVPWTGAMAQERTPGPPPGARVRITVPCDRVGDTAEPAETAPCRSVGSLQRISGDSISLRVAGSPITYGLTAVRRLEVSRGERSRWIAGAGIGFVAGVGSTVVLLYTGGSTSLCDRSANQDAMAPRECIGLTALGGLAGAALGASVGALIRTERWRDVPVERFGVGLGPEPGGALGLAVTVAF